MGKTKYFIYLTDAEKAQLNKIIETEPEPTAIRAKILLASDFNNPQYLSTQQLADALGVSHTTVQTVRTEYTSLGLTGAVYPKGKQSYDRRANMTDEKRKEILEMIQGQPPFGQRRWTVMSICEECVNRGIFSYVAKSVIQKLLNEEQIDLKNPRSRQ